MHNIRNKRKCITSAVVHGEVTTLKHELRDDAVERRALVVKRLGGGTLLTSAESSTINANMTLWRNLKCNEMET